MIEYHRDSPLARVVVGQTFHASMWNDFARIVNTLCLPEEPLEIKAADGGLSIDEWNAAVDLLNSALDELLYLGDPRSLCAPIRLDPHYFFYRWPPSAERWNELVSAANLLVCFK